MVGIKGMKMPKSHRSNTSKAMLGNKRQEKKRSKATKKKISKKLMGNKHTFRFKHTDVMKLKCRISKIGEKNPAWQGGVSFEPYSAEWTKELKEKVQERDFWECQICHTFDTLLRQIHHIDYNKKNCLPDNLITLCRSCHSRTNHRREYWEKTLKEIIHGQKRKLLIDVG